MKEGKLKGGPEGEGGDAAQRQQQQSPVGERQLMRGGDNEVQVHHTKCPAAAAPLSMLCVRVRCFRWFVSGLFRLSEHQGTPF
jgi:hypothetical protein